MTPQQLIRTTQSRVFPYVKKNISFLFILGYCIYSTNWIAAVGFATVLVCRYTISELFEMIDDDSKEIEKWYKKYMEVKYPNLNK